MYDAEEKSDSDEESRHTRTQQSTLLQSKSQIRFIARFAKQGADLICQLRC